MFRMFNKKEQRIPAESLAKHLKEKIEEDYIRASTLTKWVDWIGQAGLERARALVDYLVQQQDKGISDADLANDLIGKMYFYKKGSPFENSKNLRVLVVNEMCRYMQVDMNALRIAVSDETTNRMTPRGLLQDPKHIEAEVAVTMLKDKISQQSVSRPGVAIN